MIIITYWFKLCKQLACAFVACGRMEIEEALWLFAIFNIFSDFHHFETKYRVNQWIRDVEA